MNNFKSFAAIVFMLSAIMGFISVYFADQIGLANFTILGIAAFVGMKTGLFAFMFSGD